MPFLAWNVIGMIFRVLMDNRLPFDGISDLLLEFSFFPFDGPLWYMFCLMLLLPLLPVIRRIRSKGIHIIILLCFSAISILLYAKIGNSASYALVDWGCRLIYYLPLYYFGVYCGLYHGYDIFMDKYKGASFAITGGVILMLTIILFSDSDTDKLEEDPNPNGLYPYDPSYTSIDIEELPFSIFEYL